MHFSYSWIRFIGPNKIWTSQNGYERAGKSNMDCAGFGPIGGGDPAAAPRGPRPSTDLLTLQIKIQLFYIKFIYQIGQFKCPRQWKNIDKWNAKHSTGILYQLYTTNRHKLAHFKNATNILLWLAHTYLLSRWQQNIALRKSLKLGSLGTIFQSGICRPTSAAPLVL